MTRANAPLRTRRPSKNRLPAGARLRL